MPGFRKGLKIFEVPNETEVFATLDRATGTLSVRSDPPGATITVDGQTRPEKTPASITLPVGKHKLEVTKEGFQKHVEEVELREAVMSIISVDWTGRSAN